MKDALKNTFFASIDELLLQVYFMYEKPPKKCRELKAVIEELRVSLCLEPSEMPSQGGSRPLRACGTRFVAHKVAALGRLVDRFGAYLLKSTALLCKVLQEDELCVVQAIECVFKVKRSMDKIKAASFEELPTVKKVLERIQHGDLDITYQSAEINRYELAIDNRIQWVEAIEACLLQRLKSQASELELLTHAITILSTHGWERSADSSFGYTALKISVSGSVFPWIEQVLINL